jgi:hypothetical protein
MFIRRKKRLTFIVNVERIEAVIASGCIVYYKSKNPMEDRRYVFLSKPRIEQRDDLLFIEGYIKA